MVVSFDPNPMCMRTGLGDVPKAPWHATLVTQTRIPQTSPHPPCRDYHYMDSHFHGLDVFMPRDGQDFIGNPPLYIWNFSIRYETSTICVQLSGPDSGPVTSTSYLSLVDSCRCTPTPYFSLNYGFHGSCMDHRIVTDTQFLVPLLLL